MSTNSRDLSIGQWQKLAQLMEQGGRYHELFTTQAQRYLEKKNEENAPQQFQRPRRPIA